MTHQELLEKYLNNLSSNVDDININNFLEDVSVEGTTEEEEGTTDGATILHIPDLSRFKNMVELDVSTCNIASLPSLDLLARLEIFTCCYNSLRSLPELNKGLKILRCSWNLLECLPTLADAPFLKEIDCSYNKLSSIDISLNLHLKKVDCSQNKISCMDISLNYCLEDLNCSHNCITTFVPFTNKHRLKYLDCSHNHLTEFTSIKKSLVYLNVSFNKLTSLPTIECIVDLNCSNNPMYTFPKILHLFYMNVCTHNTYFHTILASHKGKGDYAIRYECEIYNRIKIWNRFRELCFMVRLRNRFISWMWKSRERKIRELCHYKHLDGFLNDNELEGLDTFLETFGVYK